MKLIVSLLLSLIITECFAQFDFVNDPVKAKQVYFISDTVTHQNLKNDDLLDSTYKPDKKYEFEFRFWKLHLEQNFDNVFILTFKNNKWAARYFDLNNSRSGNKTFTERKVKQSNVSQLWETLVDNNVLTLPDSQTLTDKMVKYKVDTANLPYGYIEKTDMRDGVLYCFELLTLTRKKFYQYGNPQLLLNRYGNIKELYNVVMMITLIQKFLGQPLKVY